MRGVPVDGRTENKKTYPSIRGSLWITVIVISMFVVCSPLLFLRGAIGVETTGALYYILSTGLAFLIVHWMRRRRLGASRYNFRIGSWRLVIPLACGSLGLMGGVVVPIVALIPIPVSDAMQEALQDAIGQTGPPTFVYFVIAAPLLEELVFRGVMLDGLLKRYRPVTAILVSSLLFGIVHLNAPQFVMALVIGCFLGWVYLRSRSVGACIVIHMSANLSGYIARFVIGVESEIDGQGGVLESWGGGPLRFTAVTASLLVVFALSVWYLKRQFDAEVRFPPEEVHA